MFFDSLFSITMSSTNDVIVASGESAKVKREKASKKVRKRDGASETAEQREERLSIRDRARRAAQSVKVLQLRLNTESGEERDTANERRDKRAAESSEQRKALPCSRSAWRTQECLAIC